MFSQLLGGVKDGLIFSFTSDTEIGNWRKFPPSSRQHPKDQHICKHILQTLREESQIVACLISSDSLNVFQASSITWLYMTCGYNN